ncbi:hypothetical protein FB451DRAFT_1375226 [Mycena latifolia]|nr:hypothetical protein FB451DRAFT_1375226 [Mycena latifolia]
MCGKKGSRQAIARACPRIRKIRDLRSFGGLRLYSPDDTLLRPLGQHSWGVLRLAGQERVEMGGFPKSTWWSAPLRPKFVIGSPRKRFRGQAPDGVSLKRVGSCTREERQPERPTEWIGWMREAAWWWEEEESGGVDLQSAWQACLLPPSSESLRLLGGSLTVHLTGSNFAVCLLQAGLLEFVSAYLMLPFSNFSNHYGTILVSRVNGASPRHFLLARREEITVRLLLPKRGFASSPTSMPLDLGSFSAGTTRSDDDSFGPIDAAHHDITPRSGGAHHRHHHIPQRSPSAYIAGDPPRIIGYQRGVVRRELHQFHRHPSSTRWPGAHSLRDAISSAQRLYLVSAFADDVARPRVLPSRMQTPGGLLNYSAFPGCPPTACALVHVAVFARQSQMHAPRGPSGAETQPTVALSSPFVPLPLLRLNIPSGGPWLRGLRYQYGSSRLTSYLDEPAIFRLIRWEPSLPYFPALRAVGRASFPYNSVVKPKNTYAVRSPATGLFTTIWALSEAC